MDKAQDYYGNDEKCMWCDKQLYWDYEGEDRMVVGINGDSITAVPIALIKIVKTDYLNSKYR